MNFTHGLYQPAVRSFALLLAASLFAGCGASHMLPAAPSREAGAMAPAGAAPSGREPDGERVTVRMQVRIPHRGRRDARAMHPATISAMTRSIGIAVNGGAQQTFDTTPASPNCSIGVAGTTCTFAVPAKVGTDSFVVTTYASTGGGGIPLDRGIATIPIAKGKANAVSVHLGPAVTTTADSGVGSLRYAIATANAGDTIMFLLPAGSTIALASPILIVGTVTLAGPGAANTVTISGGNAHQIFFITGTATISGLTLAQGKAVVANTPGGAIGNIGHLTLANDKIGTSTSVVALKHAPARHTASWRRHPHCTSTFSVGGAVYNNGTLVTSGTTYNGNVVQSDVTNCITAEGGAIFNDIEGSLISSGDTFTNNSALAGGAVYNTGTGQVSFTNDTFTGNTGCNVASGCPTSGCTTAGCTSFAQGEGAAIFDAGAGTAIVSSVFANNVAGGLSLGSHGVGGALALNSLVPTTITGSVFTGNLAGGGTSSCSMGNGGAIAASTPLVLNNDTFTNNQAVGDGSSGGGAVVATMDAQGANDTFKSNVAAASGSACSTSSTGIGGAIYGIANLTLTGSAFTGNTASGNTSAAGGAVTCANCYLTSDSFTLNSATGTGAAGAASTGAAGGALYATTVAKIQSSSFTSNAVTGDGPNATTTIGGAIVMIAGSLLSGGDVFTSNTATETAGTGTAAGGAVAMAGGTMISNGDTFKSNGVSASNIGGGGAVYLNATFLISGATFAGNHASGAEGVGGALAISPMGVLTSSTLTGNSATSTSGLGAGGAIYDGSGSTITYDTIAQNTASTEGGGIFTAGSETISDTTVTANKVTGATATGTGGGGIFSTGSIGVAWTTVSNNSVTVGGAGNSGGGGIYNGGGIELLQSTISGNSVLGSAAASGGGGIYDDAASELINDTISGNSSHLDGGGIEVAANFSVALANVTLVKNVATGTGGNIDNLFAMILANSIVAGGTAASGGDIKNAGTIMSGDYNIIQTAVAGNALAGTTTHDKTVNPLLLGLSNNGGPTFTSADQTGGPGTASIPFAAGSCGSVVNVLDQRGFARGTGAHCDAGAFEYGGVPIAARHHVPHKYAGARVSHGRTVKLWPLHVAPLPAAR